MYNVLDLEFFFKNRIYFYLQCHPYIKFWNDLFINLNYFIINDAQTHCTSSALGYNHGGRLIH